MFSDGAHVIDAVICDVGGVVLLFEPQVSDDIESRFGLPEGQLMKTLLKSEATKLATVGQIDFPEWFQRVSSVIPAAAVREWLAYHGEKNIPLVETLASVRRSGVILLLLSNATGRLWADLAYHGLQEFADTVFCSADMGIAKPDSRAYTHVAGSAAIALNRALYIDDTPSWVEAGRELGMHGHIYCTPEDLTQTLITTGLLR